MADFEVYPCEELPAQIIKVSFQDAIAPKTWLLQYLFWPLEDSDAFERCYENLREGLSRLAVDAPAIAGLLTRGSDDNPRDITITIPEDASLQFPCEDVSAQETVPSYDELLRSGFPSTHLRGPLSPPVSLVPMVEGSPLFCAKFNKIKGGAVLAMGLSHVLADGSTSSLLEVLWSSHASDVSRGMPFSRHRPITLDREIRSRLSTPSDPDAEAALDPFLEIVPAEEARFHLHRDVLSAKIASQKVAATMMARLIATGQKPEQRTTAIWKFSAKNLANLKQAASGPNASDWISTLDAVAGLFWSRIARIQAQSTRGLDTSACLFMINIRQRLQPPVPDAYIGNAYSPSAAECSLAELESEDDTGLKAASLSIRRANTGWKLSRWDAWLSAGMSLPADKAIGPNRELMFGKHNLGFNDYSRFPTHLIPEWGAPLGRVARVRYVKPMHPGGALSVHVHPRFPDGTLEVSLACGNALREALMENAVFSRYAEFVCHHA